MKWKRTTDLDNMKKKSSNAGDKDPKKSPSRMEGKTSEDNHPMLWQNENNQDDDQEEEEKNVSTQFGKDC